MGEAETPENQPTAPRIRRLRGTGRRRVTSTTDSSAYTEIKGGPGPGRTIGRDSSAYTEIKADFWSPDVLELRQLRVYGD